MKKVLKILLVFTLILTSLRPVSAQASTIEAIKSSQKVSLDGKEVKLPAYLIEGRNYIKLRDFAAILSESSAKFNVTYDKEKNTVLIEKSKEYTKLADDLKAIDKQKAEASLSNIEVVVDGKAVKVSSANIDGYNYLQIRELAKLVGIGIDYNEDSKTVELSSKKAVETELKCDKEGCCCKHKTKGEFDACPCCGGKSAGDMKDMGNGQKIPSCCANKKNNAIDSSDKTDSNKQVRKEIRYKCCDGCGCKHKTMEEYKKCNCCNWNLDNPVKYEVEVEVDSNLSLKDAQVKLEEAKKKLKASELKSSEAAKNLENAKAKVVKAEEAKAVADKELETANKKLADCKEKLAKNEKVTKVEEKLNQAEKEKDQAEKAVKQAEKKLALAKNEKDQAADKLEKAEAAFKKAESEYIKLVEENKKALALVERVPVKRYNCGCGCQHISMEEYMKCGCCNWNTTDVKVFDSTGKIRKIYNCGCGCDHASEEECKACPCCKGKEVKEHIIDLEKEASDKESDAKSTKNIKQGEAKIAKEAASKAEASNKTAEEELEAAKLVLTKAQEALNQAKADAEKILSEVGETEEVKEAKKAVEDAKLKVKEAEEKLAEAKDEKDQAEQEKTKADKELDQAKVETESADKKLNQAKQEAGLVDSKDKSNDQLDKLEKTFDNEEKAA